MNSCTSCPNGEPHSVMVLRETGDCVCIKCGEVLFDHIISLEWSLARRSNNDSKADKNISSEIVSDEDRILGETYNPRIGDPVDFRLKRAHRICQKKPWKESKVLIGINKIRSFVELFNLSRNVRKNAIDAFHHVIKKNEMRAHKINLIALVLVDYWAKQDNNPLQMDQIHSAMSYSQHIFMRYKHLVYRLLHYSPAAESPTQFVARICDSLHLDYEVLCCAKNILKFVCSRENVSGCDPKGLAAGAVYFACSIKGQRRSQVDVAKAARISDITLRSRLKLIQYYSSYFQNL